MSRVKYGQEVVEEVQEAVRRHVEYPHNPSQAFFRVGIDLGVTEERYEIAFEAFLCALEIDPFFAWAHYEQGLAASALGDVALGLAHLLACCEATMLMQLSKAENPHFHAGGLLLRLGKKEEALTLLRIAASRCPYDANPAICLAELLASKCMEAEAKSVLLRVLKEPWPGTVIVAEHRDQEIRRAYIRLFGGEPGDWTLQR